MRGTFFRKLSMIKSMTAFARVEELNNFGNIVCELRSVNHRYLDLSLRVPESFSLLEPQIRENIRRDVQRGKVEFFLRVQNDETVNSEIKINNSLVSNLQKVILEVGDIFKDKIKKVNPIEILNWPGVLSSAKIDLYLLQNNIMQLLKKTLAAFSEAREREGAELKKLFLERLNKMKIQLTNVRKCLPEIEIAQRNKLIERFNLAKIELDTPRLEQELVLFAQKIDVSEELDRLDAHIAEVTRILEVGGAAGRRLDFLMQELNREANTLGSKSVNVAVTRASIELKVLIEQMREQVQNIE